MIEMTKFRDLSIRWKIILIIVVIAVQTLILSAGGFIYNDLHFFKKDIMRNLKVLASAVGYNSRAALVFLDAKTAQNNLLSLKVETQIQFAALYDANGESFANYARNENENFRHPTTLTEGQFFYKNHIEIIHPIILDGEKVGKIYLNASLKEFDQRLEAYLLIVVIILLATLLVSIALSAKLQTIISAPILYLANMTRKISQTSDYSLRVNRRSEDELGVLFSGFNDMLTQIQTREEDLVRYRKSLEEKVVECRLTGEELKSSEESTRTILDNAFDAIIIMDESGVVQTWNKRAAAIFEWTPEEILGEKLVDKIIPPRYRKAHREGLERFKRTGTGKMLNQQIEITALRRDGSEFPIELAISAIKRKGTHIITGIIRDITERKRAQENIVKTQDQLRNLSRRLQSAREEEKTHIAREIHDELGQTLTALKLDLSWVSKNLTKRDEDVLGKIGSMIELVENTIKMVQRIASELRPQILDILGLSEALRWQAKQFQNRTGIDCELTMQPEDIELDPDRSIAFFRIFQEALTNIARHAEATKIQASFKLCLEAIVLKVEDNGKGMDLEKAEDPSSLGLIGIRERSLVWGGQTTIKSQPGHGTLIEVSIPLELP